MIQGEFCPGTSQGKVNDLKKVIPLPQPLLFIKCELSRDLGSSWKMSLLHPQSSFPDGNLVAETLNCF